MSHAAGPARRRYRTIGAAPRRPDRRQHAPAARISVDYHVAEVVDGTQVVTGKIPKAVFHEALGQ